MPRLACLAVRSFALAARLRAEPDLSGERLAIAEGRGGAARIVEATRSARRTGVRPGLTLPQARAIDPGLVVRPRDKDCERAAQEALLEIAESFSPRVEDAGEGTAYLDLEGLERLFPGGSFETDLGRSLLLAAERAGLPARAGIAGSKLAARVAASLPDAPAVVPAGEEAAFLAPLPLSRLEPPERLAAVLEEWGVRTIGDLARLPAAEVGARLGRTGQDLHAAARGIDPRPLIPREPPSALYEGMDLEWPLDSLEPFLFVGRAALERICARLEARGLACGRLQLTLRLDPEGHATRTLDLPAPLRDSKTLLTLVRLALEARPPRAPVIGFAFTAHPDRMREAQLSLFGPAALSPDRLATTLGRLAALAGADGVGAPERVDGHAPARFALAAYRPPPPPPARRGPAPARGLLAVRALRPPVEIEVLTGPARPFEIRTPPGELGGQPRIEGRVKAASGPWDLEEAWWENSAVGREYWDVELTDQGIYRIFRDAAEGSWYADGVYD